MNASNDLQLPFSANILSNNMQRSFRKPDIIIRWVSPQGLDQYLEILEEEQ